MRSIKYLLILGIVSIVSIGIYVGQVLSVDKTNFVVETIKGNPKQDAVQNMRLILNEWSRNPNGYSIDIEGNVQRIDKSILFYIFQDENRWEESPREFRQFIFKHDTHLYTQDLVTYGLRATGDGEIELQYWDVSTKKLTRKTFDISEIQQNRSIRFSPFQRMGNMLLIESYIPNRESVRENIFSIDLNDETVSKIKLPSRLEKGDVIRSFYDGKMIVEQMHQLKDSDTMEVKIVVKDGQKTKQLNRFADFPNGTYIMKEGRYLVGIEESDESSEQVQLRWHIYDIESDRQFVKTIKLKSFAKNEVISYSVVNEENDHIYIAYRMENGAVKAIVVNPLTAETVFETEIKNKGSKNKLMLEQIITN